MKLLIKRCLIPFRSLNRFGQSIFSFGNAETMPILVRKPDSILVKQWWSQTPFDKEKSLTVPIYDFKTGEFAQETMDLDQRVFNQPLRRDLIHRVYEWRRILFYNTTHIARTKGTTRGSGRKPFQQKGTGRARQGNLRAPGRKKGGKAFGPKPRDHGYKIPKKVRLTALKAMLSAKLAEGKIRVVVNEKLDEAKTRTLGKISKTYGDKIKILLITGYEQDKNLEIASRNIENIKLCLPNRINIVKLLEADRVIFTKKGINETTQDLIDRTTLKYKKTKGKRDLLESEIQRKKLIKVVEEDPMPKYDPEKPLQFKFRVLEEYLKVYEKNKSNEKTNSNAEIQEK